MNKVFLPILFLTSISQGATICLSIDQGLDRMCARHVTEDASCSAGAEDEKTVAWREESCVNPTGQEVIPEIVNLRQNQPIPAQIYSSYSSEKIATSIVYRYFQKYERPHIKEADILRPNYDVYADASPVMAIEAQYMALMIKNGFLNQHVTRRSRALMDLDLRIRVEDALLNLQIEESYTPGASKANEVRPKYTYGFFSKPAPTINNTVMLSYGETLLVFKDSVKKRAMLSNEDSIDNFRMSGQQLIAKRTSFYNSSKNFTFEKTHTYYEAQIWGRLTFDDVAYILTDCFNDNSSKYVLSQVQAANLKVPVYRCKIETSQGLQRAVPTKLLAGEPYPGVSVPKSSMIEILSATVGQNLPGQQPTDVTKFTQQACNEKIECSFGITEANRYTDYSIEYTCSSDVSKTRRTAYAPAGSVGRTIQVKCDD